MKTMRVLDSLNDLKKNTISMENWYKKTKPKYELYDIVNDPYELNNLYSNKDYDSVLYELKNKLNNWIKASDYGNMNEEQMLEEMFSNEFRPMKLNVPTIKKSNEGFIICSNNSGASIAYRTSKNLSWKIIENDNQIISENAFELLMFKPGYELFLETFK